MSTVSVIELYRPHFEFWIVPADENGQWITVSRFDGKLHVRGTYVDATAQAKRLATIAYLAMEKAFREVALGRERGIRTRVR